MLDVIIASLVMMVLGGGIAYLGDWLGLNMGKRRLSLFNLRPRSTARLLTVTAGSLIALMTFLVLLGVDRGFRIAVQHSAEYIEQNHHLTRENRQLQKRADQAQADLQQAQASLQQAHNSAAQASAQRAQAQAALQKTNQNLNAAKQTLTATQTQLNGAQAALLSTHLQLDTARRQLADARSRSKALETTIAEQKTRVGNLGYLLAQSQNALLYRNGAEVGRTVIKAGQPVGTIRQQINAFLTQLSAQALEHGAGRGKNGHAVRLLPVALIPTQSGTVHAPVLTRESDSINALADNIHNYNGGNGSVVVIARAYGNAFAGSSVGVTLQPFRDRLVLPQGTLLASVAVGPSDQDPDQILSALQSLLQKARIAAVHAGVIPVVINPTSHETQLGNIPLGELFRVVDQVRRSPKPATITVTAAQDTYSTDQLKIKFVVSPPHASNGA